MLDITKVHLPEQPGVYIYKDTNKKVLYVGKAVNLKNRVKSYFARQDLLDLKTSAMISKAESIETIEVNNELEALLLEADLIKRYKPPYNISLKDDKYYKYIVIEKPDISFEGQRKRIAKISTTRKKSKVHEYFGPYPESNSILLITKTLRKIFPFRDCSTQKFNRYHSSKRPCLYGHIGLCPAPCQSFEGINQNNNNVAKIRDYLLGKRVELFKTLEREMKTYSTKMEFEKAAYIRDQLSNYDYLKQKTVDIKEYISNPSTIQDKATKGLEELCNLLLKYKLISSSPKQLDTFRIETYDISNIQGDLAVGSMVVSTGGSSDKSEYRRFRIKTKHTPDDFHMMKETLSRRFSRKDKSAWPAPDLVVIDGGKGQLSAAKEIFEEKDIHIPLVALAKREEEVFYWDKIANDFAKMNEDKNNAGIKILIAGRDEAHRYGLAYHRKLRIKEVYSD